MRGDDHGAAGLVHGVQNAVLPEVGVHGAYVDVLWMEDGSWFQNIQSSAVSIPIPKE